MAEIKINRQHNLGMVKARDIAFKWAEDVENKLDMTCTYEEGSHEDCVNFTRSGVSGKLFVTQDGFELHAKLGFLVSAFKDKIEAEIGKNLDDMLAKSSAKEDAAKEPQIKAATKKNAKRSA